MKKRNLKLILRQVVCAVLALMLMLSLVSCGSEKIYTNKAETEEVSFGDVFSAFSEFKDISVLLLNEPPTEYEWWVRFNAYKSDAKPIYEENKKLLESGELNNLDKRLATVLDGVLLNYIEAYETMAAAENNIDAEIITYAYNKFSEKIANSNVLWNYEIKNVQN